MSRFQPFPLIVPLAGRLPLDVATRALLLAELMALFARTVGHGAALWWLAAQVGAGGLTRYGALMAALALLSLPLLSPLGDRISKRRLVVGGQVLLLGEALGLVGLSATGGLSLIALCVCGGLGTVASAAVQPAQSALLLDTVSPADLPAAIRWRRGAQALGSLAGPALGGVAVAAGDVGWAFALQALLAVLAWRWSTRIEPSKAAPVAPREPWLAAMRAGLRAKWRVRVDRGWSLSGALMMVFFLPATGLLLPLRLQTLGASPVWLGVCGSLLSLGVLVGVLGLADRCMARCGRMRAMLGAIVLCGLSLAGLGLADRPWALALCFGVVGLCLSVTQLMGQTHRALAVPEDFRARMAAAQLTLAHVAATAAPVLAGLCLARWPVAQVQLLMSAGFLLAGLALLAVPDLRTFLAAAPDEAVDWYERRYPEAFRRA